MASEAPHPIPATSGHRGRAVLLVKALRPWCDASQTHVNAVISARLNSWNTELHQAKVTRLRPRARPRTERASQGPAATRAEGSQRRWLLPSTYTTERARPRGVAGVPHVTQRARLAELPAAVHVAPRGQPPLGALCCRSASDRSLTLGLPTLSKRQATKALVGVPSGAVQCGSARGWR